MYGYFDISSHYKYVYLLYSVVSDLLNSQHAVGYHHRALGGFACRSLVPVLWIATWVRSTFWEKDPDRTHHALLLVRVSNLAVNVLLNSQNQTTYIADLPPKDMEISITQVLRIWSHLAVSNLGT